MNITPIVNKGLSFNLNHYCELKTERNGPNFWFIDHSNTLRDKLAPFLPRMDYDSKTRTVTASIVENGKELLSTSEAATPSLNNVPAEELVKLRAKIKALLADTQLPDEVRRVVEAFTLPKPGKMSECYRVYGSGNNKRLAIVWGLSLKDAAGKEDLESVLPLRHFLGYMEDNGVVPSSRRWKWILLALAAAGIALYALNSENTDTPEGNSSQTLDLGADTTSGNTTAANSGQTLDLGSDTTSENASVADSGQTLDLGTDTPSGNTTVANSGQTLDLGSDTTSENATVADSGQTLDLGSDTTSENVTVADSGQTLDLGSDTTSENTTAANSEQTLDLGSDTTSENTTAANSEQTLDLGSDTTSENATVADNQNAGSSESETETVTSSSTGNQSAGTKTQNTASSATDNQNAGSSEKSEAKRA